MTYSEQPESLEAFQSFSVVCTRNTTSRYSTYFRKFENLNNSCIFLAIFSASTVLKCYDIECFRLYNEAS